MKACRINTLANVEKSHATAIGKTISKMNADLADKIGRLMLHTYSDAKKLTHSEFSFPARVVTCEIANQLSYSKQHLPATETIDFQILLPAATRNF